MTVILRVDVILVGLRLAAAVCTINRITNRNSLFPNSMRLVILVNGELTRIIHEGLVVAL